MHWPCILDSGFHPHTGLGTMETDMNAASIWQKCAIVLRTRLASVGTEVRRAATLSQQLGTLFHMESVASITRHQLCGTDCQFILDNNSQLQHSRNNSKLFCFIARISKHKCNCMLYISINWYHLYSDS
jgi:hypothetical protein